MSTICAGLIGQLLDTFTAYLNNQSGDIIAPPHFNRLSASSPTSNPSGPGHHPDALAVLR